jgi:hypothetical protein
MGTKDEASLGDDWYGVRFFLCVVKSAYGTWTKTTPVCNKET